MSTTEIENILRHAPQPRPPGILKQQLKAQALRVPRTKTQTPYKTSPQSSWLGRWWPALAPAAVTLACAAIFTMQQSEIRNLKTSFESAPRKRVQTADNQVSQGARNEAGALSAADQDELSRLRTLASNLRSEVSKLEQMRLDNHKLREQLASSSSAVLNPDEVQALEQARERALTIQCVNNLKQLGLAVKVWSLDNANMTPPNVLSMSNEMGSFKILVCPADSGRQAARDPISYTAANCSYEYLAPSVPDNEPNRILFRCPIHGNVCLCDGSVQMELAKKHPEQLVQKDGKLYAGPPAGEAPPTAEPSNQNQ
jgi:hypothetical protein